MKLYYVMKLYIIYNKIERLIYYIIIMLDCIGFFYMFYSL